VSRPRNVSDHLLRIDELGVVVLAYGRSNQHAPLLADLQAAGVSDEHVVVVHNPDAPTHGWRPACPPSATLIALPRNLGYATAMNRGIGASADQGHRAVLLLTHDTRIEPNTIRTLLDAANAAPEYGVLGLAVRGAGGALTSYGSYMDPEGIVRHNDERPHGQHVADSMFVDGSAMFLRLDACGRAPMPERYFMYFEEAEVCSSARMSGWGVGTALEAVANSVSGIENRRAAFQYLYVRNGLDWTYRYRGARSALAYGWHEMRRAMRDTPKPGGRRFRDPRVRRSGYAQLLSRSLAVIDFLRRRWGPPPRILVRMSDIRNV
jgi:GT2 family glycosyltransferase